MKIPESPNTIYALINKSHEERQEPPRPHLGASMLGHPCNRWLWLSFRWAVIEKFEGRILRLFRRGQLEENTIVSDLRSAGLDVRNTSANQARVDFGKHVSGSMDGIIYCGVPEAPNKQHILEAKTHALKSFEELGKSGVKKAKLMHWVQMQVYMLGSKIDRALYFAICKNDDRIYTERVRLEEAVAQKYVERGYKITLSDRMPEPLSSNSSWYECKFCAAHKFCFKSKITKEINCRTCAHSTAIDDSTWRCERHDADNIPYDWQLKGCDSHVLHPDLVPWQRKDGDDNNAVYIINGKEITNGEDGYKSSELIANFNACASDDLNIAQIRNVFDASIIG